MQKIFEGEKCYCKIGDILKELGVKKFMLVGKMPFHTTAITEYFENIKTPFVMFKNFTANPKYEEICEGVDLFNAQECDAIVAVGGGSAIDVAKCIKLFSKMQKGKLYFEQELFDTKIPLLAVPTTAGTGSESTKFSVFYYKGEKQSIAPEYLVPEYAFLDETLLYSLPEYQKKCTLLDALCQAIESWWSVHSNDQSKSYAKTAVEKIIKNYKGYIFDCNEAATKEIMLGSNYAGKAINITSTTAPHAMSYKLTTLYGIPHGHSVGIGLDYVWEYMINNIEKCADSRGAEYLLNVFDDIAKALGGKNAKEGSFIYKNLLKELEISGPKATKEELEILTNAVNVSRLKSHPLKLDRNALYELYKNITQN
ncbi:MAG: phosphonoacetaldehyde reductase [Ruminococcaceae bacterium]|nr:phosphonoacetaldehyde reductase [Oscillospiraceae bacterium]